MRPFARISIATTVLAGAAAAWGAPPVLPPVPQGTLVPAARPEVLAERFRMPDSLVAGLARLAPGDVVAAPAFPVAAGVRAPVTLRAVEVWADGAQAWVSTGGELRPIGRSDRVHLVGAAEDGSGVRMALTLEDGVLSGRALGSDGWHELVPAADGTHRLVPADGLIPAGEPLPRGECSTEDGPELLVDGPLPGVWVDPEAARAVAARGAAVTSWEAVLAFDTDNEFNHLKFGNDTGDAVAWIEDLVAGMNVIYERDLGVRFVVGTVILRLDPDPSPTYDDDPWTVTSGTADNAHLAAFGTYWSANMGWVERAFAVLLSGKGSSPNGSSGIAWLDGYCETQSTGGGYSVDLVSRASWIPVSFDVGIEAHELGHNFGSHHTHCYSPPIDRCYSGECYVGTTSCPAGGGTLMSYCHTLSGCSKTHAFHPTVIANLDGYVSSHAGWCLPAVATIFTDGFEAGCSSRWSGAAP